MGSERYIKLDIFLSSCCLEEQLLDVISIIKKEAWDYPLKHMLQAVSRLAIVNLEDITAGNNQGVSQPLVKS